MEGQDEHIVLEQTLESNCDTNEHDSLPTNRADWPAIKVHLERLDRQLTCNPRSPSVWCERGDALREVQLYEQAFDSYSQALALDREHARAYNGIGIVLAEKDNFKQALTYFDRALELRPGNIGLYRNRAQTSMRAGLYTEALADLDTAIALDPKDFKLYYNRGYLLSSLGRFEEAEEMFLHVTTECPTCYEAWFHLTTVSRSAEDLIPRILAVLNKPVGPALQVEWLCFALGNLFDKAGRYEQAFEYYRRANDLCKRGVTYESERERDNVEALINVFDREFCSRVQSNGPGGKGVVFIVGMPRSGTTVLASMLSNHPAIASAGELLELNRCVSMTEARDRYPYSLRSISPSALTVIGDWYQKSLRSHAKNASARYVIDKMPFNYNHIGMITMMFPCAAIIHCIRSPLDTCLSNYMQFFNRQLSYSFDLSTIADKFNHYDRLMRHWHQVLPHRVYDVNYEELVVAPEPVMRSLLQYLDLEWYEDCCFPERNAGPVATASRTQVRRPLYSSSLFRWKKYSEYLEVLKRSLDQAIVARDLQ